MIDESSSLDDRLRSGRNLVGGVHAYLRRLEKLVADTGVCMAQPKDDLPTGPANTIQPGTTLTFDPHGERRGRAIAATMQAWIDEVPTRGCATYVESSGRRRLLWAYDGQRYSPSALTAHIADAATLGRGFGKNQGTMWWLLPDGRSIAEVMGTAPARSSPKADAVLPLAFREAEPPVEPQIEPEQGSDKQSGVQEQQLEDIVALLRR